MIWATPEIVLEDVADTTTPDSVLRIAVSEYGVQSTQTG